MSGSPPGLIFGYDDEAGQLTEKVRRHMLYSVILFDEIGAHPDALLVYSD